MSMRGAFILALSVLLVACIGSCTRKGTEGGLKVKGGVAGRVGNVKISEQEVQRRFDELSEQQRKEFKGREGKAAFVDKLIEQKLLYQAALAEGLDKDDEAKLKIEYLTENVLVGEYYRKNVEEKIKITEKDIEEYYNTHQQEFTNPPVLRAHYLFSVDSLKAAGWVAKLSAGANFNRLVKEESEDKTTAQALGDLGYFNPGGYIKSVGYSDAISKAAEKLSVNEISPVIHFEKGYAVLKLTERNPSSIQALTDVTKLIEGKVMRTKAQEIFSSAIERLKQKYPAENYVRETLKESTRSSEELWEMAQLEEEPHKRIQFYRDIVNLYPTHKNAPQALFMIGFVYAEDLQDFVMARRSFDELQQKYSESDMNASAKWMIENMGKPRPRFESLEKMQKAMDDEKVRTGAGGK